MLETITAYAFVFLVIAIPFAGIAFFFYFIKIISDDFENRHSNPRKQKKE